MKIYDFNKELKLRKQGLNKVLNEFLDICNEIGHKSESYIEQHIHEIDNVYSELCNEYQQFKNVAYAK